MSYTDMMDRAPNKFMKVEVNLSSEKKENDFYIYEKKVSGGVKNTDIVIFSRKKLEKEDVKVEATPLRLPNRLIYFEYDCKFWSPLLFEY